MRTPVFMDHQSTTPLDPQVLDAMLPYLGPRFGNASSRSHAFGWDAAQAVERARASVGRVIGARPDEIVFTSGATESNNLALAGAAEGLKERGRHVIVGATEHRAVLDPARRLEETGFRVTRATVDRSGRVRTGDVASALAPDTVLVSLMAANNEVGTLHPLREVGEITRGRGVWLHTDAAQAFGRVRLDVEEMGLDLVSLSAHKIHGPKGVGALYVRSGLLGSWSPQDRGGGHEVGLRSGTLNVPGIVGFGVAADLARESMEEDSARLAALRDRLLAILRAELGGVELNGHARERLPNNLNVRFEGVDGEALLTALDDVALATGSACMSAKKEPSHVLQAMGLGPDQARGSVRFGLGRFTTGEEVEYVARRVVEEVSRLRRVSASDRAAH